MLNTHFLSSLFVGGGIQASVCAGLFRGVVEGGLVGFQAGLPLMFIRRIAIQNAIMADNPAIHFVEPDFMTIFHRAGFLPSANDVSMSFKDADDFLLGWHTLVLKDPPPGLVYHLFCQGNKVLQRCAHLFGGLAVVSLEFSQRLARLANDLFGEFHQLAVEMIAHFFGLLGSLTHRIADFSAQVSRCCGDLYPVVFDSLLYTMTKFFGSRYGTRQHPHAIG